MTNKQIGAAFVAMCNGTTEKKTINGRNNLSVRIAGTGCTTTPRNKPQKKRPPALIRWLIRGAYNNKAVAAAQNRLLGCKR